MYNSYLNTNSSSIKAFDSHEFMFLLSFCYRFTAFCSCYLALSNSFTLLVIKMCWIVGAACKILHREYLNKSPRMKQILLVKPQNLSLTLTSS